MKILVTLVSIPFSKCAADSETIRSLPHPRAHSPEIGKHSQNRTKEKRTLDARPTGRFTTEYTLIFGVHIEEPPIVDSFGCTLPLLGRLGVLTTCEHFLETRDLSFFDNYCTCGKNFHTPRTRWICWTNALGTRLYGSTPWSKFDSCRTASWSGFCRSWYRRSSLSTTTRRRLRAC